MASDPPGTFRCKYQQLHFGDYDNGDFCKFCDGPNAYAAAVAGSYPGGADNTFSCKKYDKIHFGFDHDESNHCRFCDGPHTGGSILTRDNIRRARGASLGPDDFDRLRASIPPPSPVGAGTPMGAGIGGRMPRYPTAGFRCGPGVDPDVMSARMYDAGCCGSPSVRQYPEVVPSIRAHGLRPAFRSGLGLRLALRFLELAIPYLERRLDMAYDLKSECMLRMGEGMDPGPDPGMWRSFDDTEIPEYAEEIPFANNLYCGVFGRGGLAK